MAPKVVAWIVGGSAGIATGAAIYTLARKKGFAAVEKAGEGGFVWFLIALAVLLVGRGTYVATRKHLEERAKAKADATRIPPARTIE